MVKHNQTIRRLLPTNLLNMFNHFVRLAPKGLTKSIKPKTRLCISSTSQTVISHHLQLDGFRVNKDKLSRLNSFDN